jgi:hypothetical protein
MAYRRRVSYTYKAPKVKARKVKEQRPKGSELAKIYKKILVGKLVTRIAVLHEALAWWDTHIPYFIKKRGALGTAQQKYFEVANKSRNLGSGAGAREEEQETALKTALTYYEKIWATAFKLPIIKTAWDRLLVAKPVLEQKAAAASARYTIVTEALNHCFSQFNVTFDVHKAHEPRQYDGAGRIMLSTELARTLLDRTRKEGLLPAIFSEAVGALQAAAVERDSAGAVALNLQKFAQLVPAMLDAILRYCATVPRSKVFRGYTGVDETTPAAPTVKGSAPTKSKPTVKGSSRARDAGELVGGRYRPGSGMAQLYERVADGVQHELADVLKGLPFNDPASKLKWLNKNGVECKLWTVEIIGQKIRLIKTPAAARP